MIIISKEEVHQALTMPRCISLMREALTGLEEGVNTQSVRSTMAMPTGLLGFMPCYLGARHKFGAKIISVYPENSKRGLPSHQGQVLLFEEETGEPVALVDAGAITDIRTAAVSAAVTDLLARKDSRHLAMLGSGAQAIAHLEAMLAVRDIQEVTVWSYPKAHGEQYVENMKKKYPKLPITLCETAADAVKGADIICTVCHCTDPILFGNMVSPGTHINAVGACTPTTREVSSDLVKLARLYVDQVEACRAESGEYLIPLKEGIITKDHIVGTVGAAMLGRIPGRLSPQEITLFDSLGLATEDVVCADALYQEKLAQEK